MKLSKQNARNVLWEALYKHDGDRAKAAKEMGVSNRTFYRYLRDFEMYPLLDRAGWTQHSGPPRGEPRGTSVVRVRILAHIKKNRGRIDYADLATEIYGSDTPVHRQRIYSALEDMKKRNRVTQSEDDTWSVVRETTT